MSAATEHLTNAAMPGVTLDIDAGQVLLRITHDDGHTGGLALPVACARDLAMALQRCAALAEDGWSGSSGASSEPAAALPAPLTPESSAS